MSTPILTTKLFVAAPRPNAIRRPRLLQRLDESLGSEGRFTRKLTLVSAPAGFGKTSLVAEWAQRVDTPVAWLSLDDGDGAFVRFFAYVVAAIQTIVPRFGEGVWSALHTSPPPPLEGILTVLLNELATLQDGLVLILDDYHVVDAEPVDQALRFLLEHLPPTIHLVITTREDPQLPLSRLRARGQVTELRAADLRFTSGEAAGFLHEVMGFEVAPEDVEALAERTEGWIAGLQLAALSMQGRDDVHAFVQAFAGDDRYILDYLVNEVLLQQPKDVRNFLLQTSILDRLTGSLCDAVVQSSDSDSLLEALQRDNLFVVPLDEKRRWYRYHHLFADMLRTYLIAEHPGVAASLHQRATDWYAQQGDRAAAIRHALAAKDYARGANLVELAWRDMDRSMESVTWQRWVEELPDDVVRARPVLSLGYAWSLMSGGDLAGGEAWLRDAERWIESPSDFGASGTTGMGNTALHDVSSADENSAMVVADEDEFRLLPASAAAARAFLAQATGDAMVSFEYARHALELYPVEEHAGRAVPAAIVGLTNWALGDLDGAFAMLSQSMDGFRRAGNIVAALSGTYGLADIRVAQGRLREATRIYEDALAVALAQGQPYPRGTAELYLGLADLALERDDLGTARDFLTRSEELGEQAALQNWPPRLRVVQARLRHVEGDLDGALALLDEAERKFYPSPVPDLRPISALKVPIWLAQGRTREAEAWADKLSVDDELSYVNEFEHVTLARVLIARSERKEDRPSLESALQLLTRLLDAAEAGGRMGDLIQTLALQALALEAQGDSPGALTALERALNLAGPEGYFRVFVDAGPQMASLLSKAARQGMGGNYVQGLLEASGPPVHRRPIVQDLVEPLSERELDVLSLLRTELTGPEIARELMVSLNTMRTHSKNIYAKLGVNSRQGAVDRAYELGLF